MAPREETRLDAGRLLAGAGGLLLVISLFLDWYTDASGSEGISAWNSFELIDVILAALAALAIYGAIEGLAAMGRRLPAAALAAAGPVALLLVVVSIVNKPPILLFTSEPGLDAGIWIALAASLAMTAGALLTRVRISFVVSSREPAGEARGEGPADADAEPETRAMPRRPGAGD